jgi:hypothetical protein
MINNITLAAQPIQHLHITNILNHRLELRIGFQVFYIRVLACTQVINDGDGLTSFEQALGQMAANEACPTGNQCVRQSFFPY